MWRCPHCPWGESETDSTSEKGPYVGYPLLASLDLTAEERDGFARMDHADFDQALAGVDERVSKGIIGN